MGYFLWLFFASTKGFFHKEIKIFQISNWYIVNIILKDLNKFPTP